MSLRVIVAGMGSRGQDWTRVVLDTPGFEFVAGVDVQGTMLDQAVARLPISRSQCYNDLTAALAEIECDAVIVATASDQHVEPCTLALEHGRAVLVEKPFTLQLAQAARLVALAEQQRLPLVVAQNYRTYRSHRTVKRLIARGVLGPIGMFICQYYRVPHTIRPWLAKLPHSVMWGVAVHHFDALRYVLDQEVIGVMAQSYTTAWGKLPPGASLQVMLEFANGTRGTYTATYESSGHEFFERGQEFYQRFMGERATLHVFQRWLVLCARGKLPQPVWRGGRKASDEALLLRQLERTLRHGEAAPTSGRDNLQTMAILEACVQSDLHRQWVNPQELVRATN